MPLIVLSSVCQRPWRQNVRRPAFSVLAASTDVNVVFTPWTAAAVRRAPARTSSSEPDVTDAWRWVVPQSGWPCLRL